ncbi:unnamed protein product, partial [Arabidopsis halleri]
MIIAAMKRRPDKMLNHTRMFMETHGHKMAIQSQIVEMNLRKTSLNRSH